VILVYFKSSQTHLNRLKYLKLTFLKVSKGLKYRIRMVGTHVQKFCRTMCRTVEHRNSANERTERDSHNTGVPTIMRWQGKKLYVLYF